ncbi:hypothetical protein ACIQVR_32425 [Streptomyces xanthochromogenes]|uniref:hypothetical protein n=1 Tax=Streptomyces xanthochromogenes TaxID=67384 RepID=UPI00382979FE
MIRVALDGRICSEGRAGTIVDTVGHRMRVLFDGEEAPRIRHTTSGMEYETVAGWIAATPVSDPCLGVPVGAA